jgi:sphingomyelin phosphodiesterase
MKFASKKFDIDMILWTGDNIQHNIWEQKQETQLDNTIDLTQDILTYFPDTYVYPMFGNHEAYPCDQFDTNGNASSWLTSRLAEMWKVWLDEEAVATFQNKSYYAMVNHEHNVKIIALDTQACDTQDFYLVRDPTDPMHELEWLRNELYDSEKKKQGVFIMGHIPSGDFTCYSGKFFVKEIE